MTELQELRVDMRVCKDCRRKRKREYVGKFDPLNKRFVDDDGLTWNGNRCGKCHQHKMKLDQQKRRSKPDEISKRSG